ncbi:hypothetical protein Bpfe_026274 [Biomphalaria pfeifferi]|uniref:Uncharacterized protein n=1 Tax=Biomphalaria pfeifferi TaxID=112525 RepID=A0AAD8EXM8_BIOPF|nr:hypothetical protein Bpfe_026274 [Biomphalaria pfeifferi]
MNAPSPQGRGPIADTQNSFTCRKGEEESPLGPIYGLSQPVESIFQNSLTTNQATLAHLQNRGHLNTGRASSIHTTYDVPLTGADNGDTLLPSMNAIRCRRQLY